MSDLVLRACVPDPHTGGPVAEITPERAGWGYSGRVPSPAPATSPTTDHRTTELTEEPT